VKAMKGVMGVVRLVVPEWVMESERVWRNSSKTKQQEKIEEKIFS